MSADESLLNRVYGDDDITKEIVDFGRQNDRSVVIEDIPYDPDDEFLNLPGDPGPSVPPKTAAAPKKKKIPYQSVKKSKPKAPPETAADKAEKRRLRATINQLKDNPALPAINHRPKIGPKSSKEALRSEKDAMVFEIESRRAIDGLLGVALIVSDIAEQKQERYPVHGLTKALQQQFETPEWLQYREELRLKYGSSLIGSMPVELSITISLVKTIQMVHKMNVDPEGFESDMRKLERMNAISRAAGAKDL